MIILSFSDWVPLFLSSPLEWLQLMLFLVLSDCQVSDQRLFLSKMIQEKEFYVKRLHINFILQHLIAVNLDSKKSRCIFIYISVLHFHQVMRMGQYQALQPISTKQKYLLSFVLCATWVTIISKHVLMMGESTIVSYTQIVKACLLHRCCLDSTSHLMLASRPQFSGQRLKSHLPRTLWIFSLDIFFCTYAWPSHGHAFCTNKTQNNNNHKNNNDPSHLSLSSFKCYRYTLNI